MPKCPKCGKEIDYLNYVESGEMVWRFSVLKLNRKIEENWEQDEFYSDGSGGYFECPECGETLFNNEDEAKKFLSVEDG
jgi:predicted RNA-binding Zn-ribbon protein involved in translation (DUF1610 family)